MLDTIYKNIENDKMTGVIFLDLNKAFNMVDRNILIAKLKNIEYL